MILCAVDPGQKGMIVWEKPEGGFDFAQMPGSLSDLYSIFVKISCFQQGAGTSVKVYLEKAQQMGPAAAKSMRTYLTHFGHIEMALAIAGLASEQVAPKTWTKVMHAGTRDGVPKARSLEACRRIYPHIPLCIGNSKKPHDGLVDSLLLLEYARLKERGNNHN